MTLQVQGIGSVLKVLPKTQESARECERMRVDMKGGSPRPKRAKGEPGDACECVEGSISTRKGVGSEQMRGNEEVNTYLCPFHVVMDSVT